MLVGPQAAPGGLWVRSDRLVFPNVAYNNIGKIGCQGAKSRIFNLHPSFSRFLAFLRRFALFLIFHSIFRRGGKTPANPYIPRVCRVLTARYTRYCGREKSGIQSAEKSGEKSFNLCVIFTFFEVKIGANGTFLSPAGGRTTVFVVCVRLRAGAEARPYDFYQGYCGTVGEGLCPLP